MSSITWKQIGALCGTIVVVVWTGVAFLAEVVQLRLDRVAERQIFMRERIVELQAEAARLRGDIVAVKCRISPDLCGPGN